MTVDECASNCLSLYYVHPCCFGSLIVDVRHNPRHRLADFVVDPWLVIHCTAETGRGDAHECPPTAIVHDQRAPRISLHLNGEKSFYNGSRWSGKHARWPCTIDRVSVSRSPPRFIISLLFGWSTEEEPYGIWVLLVTLCSKFTTHQARVHPPLFVAGAEHFFVQFQDDVFEFVPGVADPIVHDGHVDLLKKIGPRFTCAEYSV